MLSWKSSFSMANDHFLFNKQTTGELSVLTNSLIIFKILLNTVYCLQSTAIYLIGFEVYPFSLWLCLQFWTQEGFLVCRCVCSPFQDKIQPQGSSNCLYPWKRSGTWSQLFLLLPCGLLGWMGIWKPGGPVGFWSTNKYGCGLYPVGICEEWL